MGEFKLVIIIIYAQSLCNHFTLCVYDADFTEDEEIERETVPSQIYNTITEIMYVNETKQNMTIENEMKVEERNRINTTAILHTVVKNNGANRAVEKVPSNGTATLELSKNSTIQQCPFFVYNSGFTIDKMPALWNSVYYKMPEKLGCFHLLIRKTSVEEREENKRIYGDFNRTINWDLCLLEIKSSSAVKSRTHFLQGGVGDFGVLRNIILVSTGDGSDGVYNLREETPDQWLMVNDLLILHACEGEEVVAFSRAPRLASKQDIAEALCELGEEMTGEMLCVDP